MDIDIVVVGHASEFWETRRLSIDFPLYFRDDQEWFSTEFRVWRDMQDPVFVFDLSSLVFTNMPLPVDILRDYTLEIELRVEGALADQRECLREAIRDKDCSRELVDMLIEDIKKMSSVQVRKLPTLKVELDQRGPALPSIEAECEQLKSRVTSLEDELAALTWRFSTLDHT